MQCCLAGDNGGVKCGLTNTILPKMNPTNFCAHSKIVTCVRCVAHLKMKERGASKVNASNTKQKLKELPLSTLEWAWERLHEDRITITHDNDEEKYHCYQSSSISDRGYREGADSLAQLEVFKGISSETAEFVLEHGRSAFTPSHLVLACNGTFLENDETASHLCGNFRCLRPEHIIVESMKSNVARKFCPGVLACRCGTENVFCTHVPQCIIKKQKR